MHMARAASKTGSKKTTPAKSSKEKVPAATKSVTPAKAEVVSPIQQLWSEIDSVFEDFARPFNLATKRSRLFDVGGWPMPRLPLSETVAPMNVSESDKSIDISVELPGMDESDVEVSVSDDMLTISGEKAQEETKEEGAVHVHERSFGSFRRSLRLPSDADADKVSASFEKGVLTVSVPKPPTKKAAAKKIKIQAKG
jgi:HSP20 family protein